MCTYTHIHVHTYTYIHTHGHPQPASSCEHSGLARIAAKQHGEHFGPHSAKAVRKKNPKQRPAWIHIPHQGFQQHGLLHEGVIQTPLQLNRAWRPQSSHRGKQLRINEVTFTVHLFMTSLAAAATPATGHDDIRPLMGQKGGNWG